MSWGKIATYICNMLTLFFFTLFCFTILYWFCHFRNPLIRFRCPEEVRWLRNKGNYLEYYHNVNVKKLSDAPTCKELRSHHFYFYYKKSETNWKLIPILAIRELKLQGKQPLQNLERQVFMSWIVVANPTKYVLSHNTQNFISSVQFSVMSNSLWPHGL